MHSRKRLLTRHKVVFPSQTLTYPPRNVKISTIFIDVIRMHIHIKRQAAITQEQVVQIDIIDRLPTHIDGTCHLTCCYSVQTMPDYFLLTLKIKGEIPLLCQRCMQAFMHPYEVESTLAVCETEIQAERLLTAHETIVATDGEVDLLDLLTDELHLNCPIFHTDMSLCDQEAIKKLQ